MLSFYTNKQRVQKPKITTFILLMCLLLSSSLSGAKFYNGNDGETCTTLFCVLRGKMASLSLDLLKVSEVRLLYLSYPCTRCCTNPRPKPGDFFETPTQVSQAEQEGFAKADAQLSMVFETPD